MRDYNKENADKLAKGFEKLADIDLNSQRRKTRDVALRTLFYKVLMDLNGMNDRDIQDWFEKRGVKKNRSSVYMALTKIDLYYEQFDYFREVYDLVLPNKPIRVKKHKKTHFKEVVEEANGNVEEREKDALDVLINSLTGSKRQEIYELVKLRIKSWEWKAKDRCEIIECSENISDFVY